MNLRLTIAALLFFAPLPAMAADCNFDRPVGGCQARIDINGSGGSKPSFWAEITLSSSAPSCSKVDYVIDATPHTAILRSNIEPESLSGTTAITNKTIKIQRCTAYEDRDMSVARQSPAEFFGGPWSGMATHSGFGSNPSSTRPVDISVSVSGASASVTINGTSYSGSVSADRLVVSKNWDNSFTETITLSRNGDGTISLSGSGAPSNISGTASRN